MIQTRKQTNQFYYRYAWQLSYWKSICNPETNLIYKSAFYEDASWSCKIQYNFWNFFGLRNSSHRLVRITRRRRLQRFGSEVGIVSKLEIASEQQTFRNGRLQSEALEKFIISDPRDGILWSCPVYREHFRLSTRARTCSGAHLPDGMYMFNMCTSPVPFVFSLECAFINVMQCVNFLFSLDVHQLSFIFQKACAIHLSWLISEQSGILFEVNIGAEHQGADSLSL